MDRSDRDDPPSNWSWPPDRLQSPVVKLTGGIYYGWIDNTPDPTFWHWCTARSRWAAAGTGGHQLVSRDPLHLEPSLLWECCGLHGFVRDGTWTNA